VETNDKPVREAAARRVSLGRHESQCRICAHARREQIEEEWMNWGNTTLIAERNGVSRDGIYRHAHALGLSDKRRRNVLMAAEKMIERVDTIPISSSAILSAIRIVAKINSEEQEEDPARGMDPKELFQRMRQDERLAFASDGSLPAWFTKATPGDPPKGDTASVVADIAPLQ
jgi:hypothetical protein